MYKIPPVPKPLGLELDEKGPHFMRLKRNIAFPPSRNLNVNMMPFIFGDRQSLSSDDPTRTVCYLTMKESDVELDACQRRPGAHTESAGYMKEETGGGLQSDSLCPALTFPIPSFCPDSLHSHACRPMNARITEL